MRGGGGRGKYEASLRKNIFPLFGRITFNFVKVPYFKALYPAEPMNMRLMLFIKSWKNLNLNVSSAEEKFYF